MFCMVPYFARTTYGINCIPKVAKTNSYAAKVDFVSMKAYFLATLECKIISVD